PETPKNGSVDPVPGCTCSSSRSPPFSMSFSPQLVFTPTVAEKLNRRPRSPSSGDDQSRICAESSGSPSPDPSLCSISSPTRSSSVRCANGTRATSNARLPSVYAPTAVYRSSTIESCSSGGPWVFENRSRSNANRNPGSDVTSLPSALNVGSPQRQIEQASARG